MTSHTVSPAALVGRSFDCVFDAFVPRITFQSSQTLRVQAKLGDLDIDQTVPADVAEVQPSIFLVSWTEDNGNFVVQLHDHEKGVVHNHARLADGQVFRAIGQLRPVAA